METSFYMATLRCGEIKNWWEFNEQVGFIAFKTHEKSQQRDSTKQHEEKIKSKRLQQQQQ